MSFSDINMKRGQQRYVQTRRSNVKEKCLADSNLDIQNTTYLVANSSMCSLGDRAILTNSFSKQIVNHWQILQVVT